ncbi:hypothetical protein PspLS_10331 [Pyricularia sp. CBS 133598]|nr:hypothetical protein PspLS_10331 [Pyricularia sp. CBS 133598]
MTNYFDNDVVMDEAGYLPVETPASSLQMPCKTESSQQHGQFAHGQSVRQRFSSAVSQEASPMRQSLMVEDHGTNVPVSQMTWAQPPMMANRDATPPELEGDDLIVLAPVGCNQGSFCTDPEHEQLLANLSFCQTELEMKNCELAWLMPAAEHKVRQLERCLEWEMGKNAQLQQRIDEQVGLMQKREEYWKQQMGSVQSISEQRICALQSRLEEEKEQRLTASSEAKLNYRNWMTAARELRKANATLRGPQHLSDQDLIDKTKQLRYMIRNFSATNFVVRRGYPAGAEMLRQEKRIFFPLGPGPGQEIMRMGNDTLLNAQILMFTDNFHIFIEAYFWSYLSKAVFGRFLWAGRAVEPLTTLLMLLGDAPGDPISRSTKKVESFKAWRAKTFDLVVKSAAVTVDADHTLQMEREDAVKSVLRLADRQLGPHVSWEDCEDEIRRIFDVAVTLDKEMHIRATPIEWLSRDIGANPQVDPRLMVLESGERVCEDQKLLLMVSPGLLRGGQEANRDDDILLPMEVFCEDREAAIELQVSFSRPPARAQPRGLLNRIDRPRKLISRLPEHFRALFR